MPLFHKTSYRIDIISAVLLKMLALTLLWALFFSHPEDKSLSQAQLARHYLQTKG